MLYAKGKVCDFLKLDEANASHIICILVKMDYSYLHVKSLLPGVTET